MYPKYIIVYHCVSQCTWVYKVYVRVYVGVYKVYGRMYVRVYKVYARVCKLYARVYNVYVRVYNVYARVYNVYARVSWILQSRYLDIHKCRYRIYFTLFCFLKDNVTSYFNTFSHLFVYTRMSSTFSVNRFVNLITEINSSLLRTNYG